MNRPTPANRRVPRAEPPPDVLELPPQSSAGSEEPGPELPKTPSRLTRFFLDALRLARTVLGVALAVGLSGALAWSARRYVRTSHRFAITDVDVTGAKRRKPDEIALEAGLTVGANIFASDLQDAKTRLLADPWISDAVISRRLPGTVSVMVTERDPVAIVALGPSYLASSDGELFKELDPGDPVDLPLVTGLEAESVLDDREGLKRTVRRAVEVAMEFERTSLAARSPLQEVNVDAEGRIALVIGKQAVRVALGDPPFRRKLDQAVKVFTELDRRGAKPEAVLLDNDARPERVVVRMR